MWQERCRVLEAQVEQLRALPAPPPDVPSDAPQRESDVVSPDRTQDTGRAPQPAAVGVLAARLSGSPDRRRDRLRIERQAQPARWAGHIPLLARHLHHASGNPVPTPTR